MRRLSKINDKCSVYFKCAKRDLRSQYPALRVKIGCGVIANVAMLK
jgi:hypothetical protein